MNYSMTVGEIKEEIESRLQHNFGVSPENATNEHYYKAVALIISDLLCKGRAETKKNAEKTHTKQWSF